VSLPVAFDVVPNSEIVSIFWRSQNEREAVRVIFGRISLAAFESTLGKEGSQEHVAEYACIRDVIDRHQIADKIALSVLKKVKLDICKLEQD
jgi:hypothetical protein